MNPGAVILIAAAIGLIVNTLAVLGVAWRGGHVLGRIDTTIKSLASEVGNLRETRDRHSEILARAVFQLDDLERRVQRLEDA